MNRTRRSFLGTMAAVASMPFSGFSHERTISKNGRQVLRRDIVDWSEYYYWQKIDWTEIRTGDVVLILDPDRASIGEYFVGKFVAMGDPFVNSDGIGVCVFEPVIDKC